MRKSLFKLLLALVALGMSFLILEGCSRASSGTSTSLTPAANFRSDKYYLSAQLPEGWASAEGPSNIYHYAVGQVAFNSWGQPGFWAQEIQQGNAVVYSREVMLTQVPAGGAYAVLIGFEGPPRVPGNDPAEYTSNDLVDLLKSNGWKFDARNDPQFAHFFKWGTSFELEVGSKADASDSTVSQLNSLLLSWKFDTKPAGNVGWAIAVARELLPDQVLPARFSDRDSIQSDQVVARKTEVTVRPDKTVNFRFTYFWNLTPNWSTSQSQQPSSTFHWWEIDVYPDGTAKLLDQGGANI
jgi:hypothetical protein